MFLFAFSLAMTKQKNEQIIIQWWSPLKGCIRVWWAKNASYKLMIASLLGSDESRLLNIPAIKDVDLVAECIWLLGWKASHEGNKTYAVDPSITKWEIPDEFGARSRASAIFIWPLLAKFWKVSIPMPGGDKLWKRPLNRLMDGLEAMGAEWSMEWQRLTLIAKNGLKGTHYRFEKNTHSGTETMIMAATLADGKTVLENAALEPEIDDMIDFLNAMGAKIRRRAFRTIEIVGVDRLGWAIHSVIPDRNVVVTYACAALISQGDVIIENARHEHLTVFLEKLDEAWGKYEIGERWIRFYRDWDLQATDIETSPEPWFMTDRQALWAVLMCTAQWTSIIHETVYPDRFKTYTRILELMGATFETFDPHVDNPDKVYNFNWTPEMEWGHYAIKIHGPVAFKGWEFALDDLRWWATAMLAWMVWSWKTILHNVEQIDRWYEKLDTHLCKMWANIERVSQ